MWGGVPSVSEGISRARVPTVLLCGSWGWRQEALAKSLEAGNVLATALPGCGCEKGEACRIRSF